jgi:polyferredoxin
MGDVPVTGPGIRKIPPDQRRKKTPKNNLAWYRRVLLRLKEDSQSLRSAAQLAFALLCTWIGVEFYLFVTWGLSDGQTAFVARPPGVEGFLPISALISLKYWAETGIINEIHPSAMFILLGILAASLIARKGFCSWLCPIGTLSESLWMFGKKLFGRNITVPRWLDYPLRSLKYVLLLFFVWSILQMDVSALRTFIYSPYNKVADIKMYLFFARLSGFAFVTLAVLVVLSIPIRNFWCRYLCPYGALLGMIGFLSPLKIVRNKTRCIDCELCTKACPSGIRVHAVGNHRTGHAFGCVWSDECTSCLACVEACPVKETLDVRFRASSPAVPNWAVGALIVGFFVAVTGLAMLAGRWQNGISQEEYQWRFQRIDTYNHFQGEVPEYGPND